MEAEGGVNEVVGHFDRRSPKFPEEVETFIAEVERWQRDTGIESFVQILEEDGPRVKIRLLPAASEPGGQLPPHPDDLRKLAGTAVKDGFNKASAAPVALDSGTAAPSPKLEESPELKKELQAFLRGRGRSG